MSASRSGITVGTSLKWVDEFVQLLASIGIELPSSCPATSELDAIRTVMKWISGQGEPPVSEDYRKTVQDAVCGIQIIELLLRRHRQGCDLKPFARHLKLLKTGSMRLSAESDAEEANHKLFELLVGLVVAAFGTDVRLAHPTKKDMKNPDVSVRIDGKGWGFACKVPHSNSALTLHDNIMKGFRQVDMSDAETGVVVMSPKNILRSSDLLVVGEKDGKPAIQFHSPKRLGEMFVDTFNRIMDQIDALIRGVERAKLEVGGKRIPVVFWLFTTATIARLDKELRPTLYTRAGGWEVPLPVAAGGFEDAKGVLERMRLELAKVD